MAHKKLNLNNIQGNVLGGFNKDFQTFVFLHFPDAQKGRAWIAAVADDISPSSRVLRFNRQFKLLVAKGKKSDPATWTNLAFSYQGLIALRIKSGALPKFPKEFRQGMAARNEIIGDLRASHPARWAAPFNSKEEIHAILLVASDHESSLRDKVRGIRDATAFKIGVKVIHPILQGRTRTDRPGHEHFGFKDGISQPGIRGINVHHPGGQEARARPGRKRLWPGEFVLGYPTQRRKAKRGRDGANPDPGPISKFGPAWTVDGSFLVFRRLHQDVPGFRRNIKKLAAHLKLSEDLVGAKLVGRYESGCPIEASRFHAGRDPFVPPSRDPGKKSTLAKSDAMNNFGFRNDPVGLTCPIAAHIRKTYPRDEETPPLAGDSASETETHRLLRRGIPFGKSLGRWRGGGDRARRGLYFLAYQNNIRRHFEFIQSKWANKRDFPAGTQWGQDPIIGQRSRGAFMLDGRNLNIHHFVQTTGGEYFFAPSISALRKIGSNGIA